MGHIKEPANIDLNLAPIPFTPEDRQHVSEVIAHYKATGEILGGIGESSTPLKKKKMGSKSPSSKKQRLAKSDRKV